MFDFLKKSSVELTETESLVNRAMTELRKGNDGDATYHPLYLAWRSFQRNPEQLTRIQDFATFGMGLTTFLSYETVSDIDEKQQISSIAYLFLSLAILKNKDDVRSYRTRALLMIQNKDALFYTVSSVVNKGSSMFFDMGMGQFKVRDAIAKMMYADLLITPDCNSVELFASNKRDIERRIKSGTYGDNMDEMTMVRQGLKHHVDICAYLNEKVLVEQDIDF